MSTTWRRSKKNQGPKARARREQALARLELNLTNASLHVNKDDTDEAKRAIEIKRKRIDKEIEILKKRI